MDPVVISLKVMSLDQVQGQLNLYFDVVHPTVLKGSAVQSN
jgi:hypothetical protein